MTKPAYVLLEGKENVRTPSLRDTMFDLLALAIKRYNHGFSASLPPPPPAPPPAAS